MWKAAEQVRLRRAVDWLNRQVPAIWGLAEIGDGYGELMRKLEWTTVDRLPERERAFYDATVDGLGREFGAEVLPHLVPELYFFPADALQREPVSDPYAMAQWLPRAVATQVLRLWIQDKAPDYAVELAVDRMRHLVSNGLANYECVPAPYGGGDFHYEPTASRCEHLMTSWKERPPVQAAIRELVDGAWDRPLEIPPPIREKWEKGGQSHLLQEYEGKGTYAYFRVGGLAWIGVSDLAARGELTVARLHDLSRRDPYLVPVSVAARDHEPESAGEKAAATLILEFLWEAVQALDPLAQELAFTYNSTGLRGTRFIVKACEHAEALGLTAITAQGYERVPLALRWLADAHLGSTETLDGLTAELRRFTPETLRAVLPHAPATSQAFLRALGWEDALPLLDVTRRTAAREHEGEYDQECDAPNCSDPESGVVNRAEIAAALEVAGPRLARDLMATLRAGQIEVQATTRLVEAVGGWNRKQIEKGLTQLGQINLKAFGLLPLERGEDEVVERYKRLRQAARDCRKFGPQRQTNTRAAVAAGIANLAQTAGYDDVSRMEWALEARISEAGASPRVAIGEYEVSVEMPGLEPSIVVRRGDRTLATVPPAVRKAKDHVALKEAVAELKAQVARYRRTLEEMMVEGRQFAAADLVQAARVPALRRLLGGLVLRQADGTAGLLADDGLVAADGSPRPLADGLQVAHPMQLIADGALATWQAAIVARRIVQPFKQVFREVYTLTELEQGADATRRFAGHSLDGRKVRRLLQARGWEVEPGDVPLPFRRWRAARLRAWFDFPEARHYLGDDEPVESGELNFTAESTGSRWGDVTRVALADVPPVLISETFRDADLMISVARVGDEAFSAESYATRAEAVVALAALSGVTAVEREGRFVKVAGRLARYRVHLASATVHVEPANVVCILPAPKRARTDGIWLPFAEADERLAEVVSKVVLLATDDTIKDKAILAQIRQASSAAATSGRHV